MGNGEGDKPARTGWPHAPVPREYRGGGAFSLNPNKPDGLATLMKIVAPIAIAAVPAALVLWRDQSRLQDQVAILSAENQELRAELKERVRSLDEALRGDIKTLQSDVGNLRVEVGRVSEILRERSVRRR